MTPKRPLLVLALAALIVSPGAFQPFATVTRLQRKVSVRLAEKLAWMEGHMGLILHPGDAVRTGRGDRVEVEYADGTVARLGPNALLVFDQLRQHGRWGWGRFLSGQVWLRIAHGERAEIVTPAAVASVIGTEFVLDVSESHATKILVLDGAVDFSGTQGDTQRVKAGYWGEAIPGQAIKPPQPIDPRSAQFARSVAAPVETAGR